MRKLRHIALLLLLSLLLVSCSGESAYLYDTGTHTHVYGNRYDVTPVSCVAEGEEIRYCKICHAAVTDTVAIAEEIDARVHTFSLTVVAATECEEGYTRKACTLCEYVVERADIVPARYALLTDADTLTVAPAGALGAVMSDTKTHILTLDAGRTQSVSAELARRLAVALTVMEELSREGSTLTPDSLLALSSGVGAGNAFSVRELLFEWVASGDADIARGFAAAIGGGESAFSARVSARLGRLGVENAASVDPFSVVDPGTVTLGATAVMLARALDEPLLAEAFADAVPRLTRIAGEKPILYFAFSDLRVSALKKGDTVRFLLLFGTDMSADLENNIFITT